MSNMQSKTENKTPESTNTAAAQPAGDNSAPKIDSPKTGAAPAPAESPKK